MPEVCKAYDQSLLVMRIKRIGELYKGRGDINWL